MDQFKARRFTNKGGKQFQTAPHYCMFNEWHNSSRCRAYVVLYHRLYKQGITAGLSVGELHAASGVDYNYLKTKLALWCSWGFCERKPVIKTGKPMFVYSLGDRGRHFLEDVVPKDWLAFYIEQIKEVRIAKMPVNII